MRENLSKRDRAACETIGRKIREARKAARKTQVDVSKSLGITQSHLSAIERGDATVGLRLVRIARALAVNP